MPAFFCNHCTIMTRMKIDISAEKNISYENFPVGSWLLPKVLRIHILTFYNFARAADDIADAINIDANAKQQKLNRFSAGITKNNSEYIKPVEALDMARSLSETNISKKYCLDLLAAFKQDIRKNRYNNWQELINYCQLSAAPVGRYLIDLHGGFRNQNSSSYLGPDALCIALQILNHIQDCREDFQKLNRIYIPLDFMKVSKVTEEHLNTDKISPELRACLNNILDKIEALITEATQFPKELNSSRLAMESHIIIKIAFELSKKLRKFDPLHSRVKLSKLAYVKCFVLGTLKGLTKC